MYLCYLFLWQFIWLRYDSYSSFVNSIIFFLSKLIIFIAYLKGFTKLLHAIFTFVFIILIFYTIKCPDSRHWKSAGNMFTCFCYRKVFRMLFTSIYFLYQRFKICLNNRWSVIRFLVLIKLYLSVFKRHITAKIIFFAYLLMRFMFVFCSKQTKTI